MSASLVSGLRQSIFTGDAKNLGIPLVILAIMGMLVVPLPSIALRYPLHFQYHDGTDHRDDLH